MQATILTAIGILLVFWGKPRLGLLIELFGLLNLFGNMFPMILAIAKQLPVLGDMITAFDFKEQQRSRSGRYSRRVNQPEQYGSSYYDPDF